jgi:transposase-like protein
LPVTALTKAPARKSRFFSFGGYGLSFGDQCIVLEEMGRALLCAPYFATAVLAAGAVMNTGTDAEKQALLPGNRRRRDDRDLCLGGRQPSTRCRSTSVSVWELPMPWKETRRMDERTQFIARVSAGEEAMTALCREYGISRKTGYEWFGRYRCEGATGLQERSHAPSRHGQAYEAAVEQAVLSLRVRWPHWGPKKLWVKLAERHPRVGSAGGQQDRQVAAARGFGRPGASTALSSLHTAVCGGDGGQ